jgi:hypothetical protein
MTISGLKILVFFIVIERCPSGRGDHHHHVITIGLLK